MPDPTGPLVLLTGTAGYTVVTPDTPLARLHYFDGRFLRAANLTAEQAYVREYVWASNRAGGSGVVHGFEAVAAGDAVRFPAGLAVDPVGRVLLTTADVTVPVPQLLARSTPPAAAPGGTGFAPCAPVAAAAAPDVSEPGLELYLLTVAHAEARCGQEDVFGKPCESPCASGTDRAQVLDGVVFRAEPLRLTVPLPTAPDSTRAHLRSQVAAAYFATERRDGGSLISKIGLASAAWCEGADAAGGTAVPLGVLARAGGRTLFVDVWTARRERGEAPPARHWFGVMAMRPWDVFLAHVLQFQCQLRDALAPAGPVGGVDPCAAARDVLGPAADALAAAADYYEKASPLLVRATGRPELAGGFGHIATVLGRLKELHAAAAAAPGDRVLLSRGIIELPSAGYLPVAPGTTVNEQVRRLLGPGVDLRFCAVRPDFVAHALEEARHMDRISLTAGLDKPEAREAVDVLVPGGVVDAAPAAPEGTGYEMTLTLHPAGLNLVGMVAKRATADGYDPPTLVELLDVLGRNNSSPVYTGAARGYAEAGRVGLHFAGGVRPDLPVPLPGLAAWLSFEVDRDPFGLGPTQRAGFAGELTLGFDGLFRLWVRGELRVESVAAAGPRRRVAARLTGDLTVQVNFGNNSQPRVVPLADEAVTLTRDTTAAAGAAPAVDVEFPSLSLLGPGAAVVSLRGTRRWAATDRAAVDSRAEFHLPGADARPAAPSFTIVELPPKPLYGAAQRVNRDVFRTGNAAHGAAVAALTNLAAVLQDPGFADRAGRKLFPPPAPAQPGGAGVRAALDWVLFHRRRERHCGDAAPAEAPPAVRRYRVFVVPVFRPEDRDAVRQAVANGGGDGLTRFPPKSVGVVEFAPGLAALDTPAAAVRADWTAAAPNASKVLYAAVASRGAAVDDGEPLAAARRDALLAALPPAASAGKDTLVEVLRALPTDAQLPAEPHDGVIVLAAAPAVVCQQVYWVQSDEQLVKQLITRIRSESPAKVAEVITTFGQGVRLGEARFVAGTDELIGDLSGEVKAQWAALQPFPPTEAFVVTPRPADPQDITPEENAVIESHRRQAKGVAVFIGSGLVAVPVFPKDAGALTGSTGCPAVTILVARSSAVPVVRPRPR